MKAETSRPAPPFYREYPVTGPLSRVVEAVWTAESETAPFRVRQTVIPDGTVNWIFNFGDPYALYVDEMLAPRSCAAASLIAGVRSHSCHFEVTGRLGLLGIRFRPGGLYPLIPCPASDLTDQIIVAEVIFGDRVRRLESRLFDGRGDADRVRVIEQTLLALTSRRRVKPQIQRAIDAVVRSRGLISVGQLADELELGYKGLERGFQRAVGLTPKVLARTIRMLFTAHEALHRKTTWTSIAAGHGFYDQAHLIAEMKQIVGTTPGAFTGERSVVASVLTADARLSNFSNTR